MGLLILQPDRQSALVKEAVDTFISAQTFLMLATPPSNAVVDGSVLVLEGAINV